MTQINGPPILIRNDQQLRHHFIRLKLIGNGLKSNRDAIGAQIVVTLNGQALWRQVMPTKSYLSQSELPVTIGLGDAMKPDTIEITWPDGSKQKITDTGIDTTTTIEQPRQ